MAFSVSSTYSTVMFLWRASRTRRMAAAHTVLDVLMMIAFLAATRALALTKALYMLTIVLVGGS